MNVPYISYYLQGFLRQPNAEKAREYLGTTEGEPGQPGPPGPPGGGDFFGPAGSTAGHLVSFGDATGKLGADSGAASTSVPTVNQKAALAGTNGAPAAGNPFVTDSDPRNTNARTPSSHAASHSNAAADPVTITNLAGFPGGGTTFLRDDATFAAPPGGGSDWDVVITKSADQTVTNNATPQNDSELFTTILESSHYLVELILLLQGNNTTGDYRGRFSFPAQLGALGGCGGYFTGRNISLVNTMTPESANAAVDAWPNNDMQLGVTAGAGSLHCYAQFQLRTIAGGGGTLQYQFANVAAAAGRESITRAGSTLRVKKLA